LKERIKKPLTFQTHDLHSDKTNEFFKG